jgi:hypothetical protein
MKHVIIGFAELNSTLEIVRTKQDSPKDEP